MIRCLAIILTFTTPVLGWAQCAMCRTQIKNNVSAGETNVAEGLNNGIIFLFFTPYLVVLLLIFLWFKYSKTTKRVSINERLQS